MSKVYDELIEAYKSMKDRIKVCPKIAIVLGSGLGNFADNVKDRSVIDYHEIPGFPVSTVAGHAGRFIFGYIKDIPVVLMQGRVHYYEGYEMSQVVMPIRLMKLMGADILLLTNAAGGIDESFKPGDLMMITDHISSFVPSPLIGENISALGDRFPDMTEVYSKELQEKMKSCAEEKDIRIKQGIYLQTTGPNYETPSEIMMYKMLGASAVGMSTACEAVAAHHAGFEVCGLSCITNMASGISHKPLSHEEVQETAKLIEEKFTNLILGFVESFV